VSETEKRRATRFVAGVNQYARGYVRAQRRPRRRGNGREPCSSIAKKMAEGDLRLRQDPPGGALVVACVGLSAVLRFLFSTFPSLPDDAPLPILLVEGCCVVAVGSVVGRQGRDRGGPSGPERVDSGARLPAPSGRHGAAAADGAIRSRPAAESPPRADELGDRRRDRRVAAARHRYLRREGPGRRADAAPDARGALLAHPGPGRRVHDPVDRPPARRGPARMGGELQAVEPGSPTLPPIDGLPYSCRVSRDPQIGYARAQVAALCTYPRGLLFGPGDAPDADGNLVKRSRSGFPDPAILGRYLAATHGRRLWEGYGCFRAPRAKETKPRRKRQSVRP